MQASLLKEIVLEQHDYMQSLDLGLKREALTNIQPHIHTPQTVIISGVRRCGKSTLLNQIWRTYYPEENYYFNFEDERLLNFGPEDFNQLYEVFIQLFGPKKVFFLDEIQNVDKWESFVRRMQDRGFKFFITGSNASLLSQEFGTKLTGRCSIENLFPFSFKEFLTARSFDYQQEHLFSRTENRATLQKYFEDYLSDGGMPLYLRYRDISILKQIYEDILYRDVIARHNIKDIKTLKELSLYLVSHLSNLFSYNKLKNMLTLGSVNTVKNYACYLENAFLIFTINQFSHSLKKQSIANKKVYCIDNGIARRTAFQFSENKGHYLENLVFIELKRRGHDIYYYKTQDGFEVDFLIRKGYQIDQLIQVTDIMLSEKTYEREINSLVKALKETNLSEGLILTSSHETTIERSGKKIQFKPIYRWLLE